MTDHDQTAVAASELAAFDGTDLEELVAFDELAAKIDAVVTSSWWPKGPVVVRRARSDAASSSASRTAADDRSPTVIRLAGPQLTVATAAHELAHVLADIGNGHNQQFRRAYLDVVRAITNLDTTDRRGDLHVKQLKGAFEAADLAVAESSSVIPDDVGGAFAL